MASPSINSSNNNNNNIDQNKTPLHSPLKDSPDSTNNAISKNTHQKHPKHNSSDNEYTDSHNGSNDPAGNDHTRNDPATRTASGDVLAEIEHRLVAPFSAKLATLNHTETDLLSATRRLESTMTELRGDMQAVMLSQQQQHREEGNKAESERTGGTGSEQGLATEQLLAGRLERLQADMTRLGEQQSAMMHELTSTLTPASTTAPSAAADTNTAAAAARRRAKNRPPPGAVLEPLVRGPPVHLLTTDLK